MRYLLLSIIIVSLIGLLLIPDTLAENVPEWIKNNAGWWASDQISDSSFLQGIQYLINKGILVIPSIETSESSQPQKVPGWIKNTAGWWAGDKISEVEFVNAIQYLIKHGIINVNYGSTCANDLSEIFGDQITMVQDICDSHESSDYSELVPFVEELNFNSLGFRGPEFSEIKPPNTYRIFMVGGSTMFGSGESSNETTIPAILQKMFDSDSFVQKIEVINAGISGGNSDSELRLINEKLVAFSPDLVVVYDGWNDLRADYPIGYTKDAWEWMCEYGNAYNFDVIITLQPIAGFGNKKLTQQETVNSLTGEDHYGFQLIAAKSTYDYMGRELLSLEGNCNVVDLRETFDDISGPIYWDQGHISDAGNLILAEKFHEIVNEIIFNKKQTESKFHSILSKYNSPIITSHLLSKIGIDVDYTQIKQDLVIKDKKEGSYFYLKNQLGASEKILVGKDLSKADLSKIDLRGQDLSGANLSGQDLRKVDLIDTILLSANLSFTNISGQDLSGKDLRGINFRSANLENADLTNITVSKVVQIYEPNPNNPKCSHLSDSFLSSIRSERCGIDVIKNETIRTDFSNANLKGVTISLLKTNNFISFVDFSGADLSGIEFTGMKFRGCNFNETNLSNSIMTETSFIHCNFSNAKLSNSEFFATAFQNVSFFNTKIIDGYFHDTLFIDTDFSNADLGGTFFQTEPIMVGYNNRTCNNHELCDKP
tara:strand:+ start:1281 stop:3416 length:2136 start_codon:yes stop_codon:yes gene_type:complete